MGGICNINYCTERQKVDKFTAVGSLMARSRAYCGLISTTGEAGESVMFTVVRLVPEGVSL
jgi:hypothetical protein